MHQILVFILCMMLTIIMRSFGVPLWACFIFCFVIGYAYHLVFVKDNPKEGDNVP